MRAISSLIRFFAWVIMIFVVLLMPLALFGRAVGQLLFTEEGLSRALSQNLLDEDVFASVAEEIVSESIITGTGESPEDAYFSQVLTNLDHESWVQVTSLVAPADLMRTTSRDFFSGFYNWLEGETVAPDFSVDLEPWKANIEASKIEVVEVFLDTIPNCSPSDVVAFNSAEDLPFCKPPEPHYSNLLDEISTEISTTLVDLPEEFSLFGDDFAGQQETLQGVARAKQILLLVRSTLRLGWVVVFILFLLAIPMGARSLPGFFKWSGIPLLLAGIGALLLSVIVSMFGGGVLAGLSAPAFSEMPSAVVTPLNAVMTGVVTGIARPILWQSFFLVVLGAGFTTVGYILSRRNYQSEMELPQHSSVMKAEDDDSPSPSGMFG